MSYGASLILLLSFEIVISIHYNFTNIFCRLNIFY